MSTILYLENKGIAFKARLACTTRYKHGRDHALVIPRKNNGHPVFISGRTNQASFKTIPLLSFLNTFKNK